MEKVADLMNRMVEEGIILDYAVFGAVAQMRYTQAAVTFDVAILFSAPNPDSIDVLGPLYDFCRDLGYRPEGHAVTVGVWPVQLIPAFDSITREAIQEAETADIEGTTIRVVGADHLAVIALSVGRAKDWTRILALREAEAVKDDQVAVLAERHGLGDEWQSFLEKFT